MVMNAVRLPRVAALSIVIDVLFESSRHHMPAANHPSRPLFLRTRKPFFSCLRLCKHAAERRAAESQNAAAQAKKHASSDDAAAAAAIASKAAAEAAAASQARVEAQLQEAQRDKQAAETAAAALQTKVNELEAAIAASAVQQQSSIARATSDAATIARQKTEKDSLQQQLLEFQGQAAAAQANFSQALAAAEAEISHQKSLAAAAANARSQAEVDALSMQPLEQKLQDAEAQVRSLQNELTRMQEESDKAHAEAAKVHANQQAAALQLQVRIVCFCLFNFLLMPLCCSKHRRKLPNPLLRPPVLSSKLPTARGHSTTRARAVVRLKLKMRRCVLALKMFTAKVPRLPAGI
jgi:chemotaxis protein histidine kinase CheA